MYCWDICFGINFGLELSLSLVKTDWNCSTSISAFALASVIKLTFCFKGAKFWGPLAGNLPAACPRRAGLLPGIG